MQDGLNLGGDGPLLGDYDPRDRQRSARSGLSRSYSNLGSRLKQMRKMCVRSQDEAGVIASTALPKLKITLHNTVIGMTRDHASKANSAD